MKKLIRIIFIVALVLIGLSSCNNTSSNKENIISSTTPIETTKENSNQNTIIENTEKNLNLNIEEKGYGKFYLINSTGTTEDNNIIYEDLNGENVKSTQLGFEAWDVGSHKTSYIYLDGKLVKKLIMDDIQSSINLEEDDLNPGKHTVEVLQFKEDAILSKENIEFYKKAEYVITNNEQPCNNITTTNCNSENSMLDEDEGNAIELLIMSLSSSTLDN